MDWYIRRCLARPVFQEPERWGRGGRSCPGTPLTVLCRSCQVGHCVPAGGESRLVTAVRSGNL